MLFLDCIDADFRNQTFVGIFFCLSPISKFQEMSARDIRECSIIRRKRCSFFCDSIPISAEFNEILSDFLQLSMIIIWRKPLKFSDVSNFSVSYTGTFNLIFEMITWRTNSEYFNFNFLFETILFSISFKIHVQFRFTDSSPPLIATNCTDGCSGKACSSI